MKVDERARHELYEQLNDILGAEASGTLMTLLPSTGWPEVATRADVAATNTQMAATKVELHAQIEALRSEVGSEIAVVRSDLEGLRSEMLHRFETVDATIMAAKNEMLATFRGEIVSAVSSQTRTMIYTMAGTLVALGGMVLALARFS